ncbi:MAG: aminotransferase class III-fold pyridoxal phosphate-dependent enzyme [Gemmatimonadaceae bacterium]|nr:aminotransferase class III-fold pyridoxal phosphate-dependent enzyme [Gemmatimonadaceae bacterium]
MAFNFFRRKEGAPPPDETAVEETDTSEEERASEEYDEGAPESVADDDALDLEWRSRAADWIPGGASTGSRRPAALYGDASTEGPAHYLRASGCHVTTASERTLIDCTMALGAVSLGYADDGVVRAVISAVASGHVAAFAHVSEVDIAERLCEVIPCAEQVRFLKSGAEGVSAAVRIARTVTSRSHVVASGYFGWHDWSNAGQGIPAEVARTVTRVPFNDLASLDAAVDAAGADLAAIVIEPVVEGLPDDAWLARARQRCDEAGAVLVYDEMKTGFRLATGGFHQGHAIQPDLAVFGKAMACGMPVSAVVGRRDVMAAATQTWISSTAAGESASLAAIGAVLDRYGEEDVCGTLARVGRQIRLGVERAVVASGIAGVSVHGLDPMWFLRFDEPALETRFLERAAALGVMFKRGAYNYAALAHDTDEVLLEIERVASTAMVEVLEDVA